MTSRAGPGPVSYTHLDVYKRQLQQFVAGGDGPGCARLQVAGGEDLADGKPLGGCLLYTSSMRMRLVSEIFRFPASQPS